MFKQLKVNISRYNSDENIMMNKVSESITYLLQFMRLTDHTMWTVLVSLCVLCTLGTFSQTLTERRLTPESAVLVQSFRKYLAGVERQRREELVRDGRGKQGCQCKFETPKTDKT